jgi:hypothetical protein
VVSRQEKRHYERVVAELAAAKNYVAVRKAARRDLLARQSEREKNGFYAGTSVATALNAVARLRRVPKE